jgi:glycosyltransferase involved in cell wall biosynthesis
MRRKSQPNVRGLSVTIITLNEEDSLPRCLDSVKPIADEIVIVDSGSTDKTIEIAKSKGAKTFVRQFDNYASQKNFAAEKVVGDWILSIDADEIITPELAREIKSKISTPNSDIVAFSIPRRNIILGREIKYSRWQSELDRHIWLWKKDKGKWMGDVHEEMVVKGRTGKMQNHKIHYQYETISEFIRMMNSYSDLEANQKFKEGQKFSYFRIFWDPAYNFLVRYFYRFGFLDGWRGFVLSYLMAIYHMIVWVKVWERELTKYKSKHKMVHSSCSYT